MAFVIIGGVSAGFHHAFVHHAFKQLEIVFWHERFDIDNAARARNVAVVIVHHRCEQKELATFEIEFPQEIAGIAEQGLELGFSFVKAVLVFNCVRDILNQADVARFIHRKTLVLASHFKPERSTIITLVREHKWHFRVLVNVIEVKLKARPILRRQNVSEQTVFAQVIKERVRHELRQRTDKFKLVRQHNNELTKIARKKCVKFLPFPVVKQQQNGGYQ